jgi:transposase-like protein
MLAASNAVYELDESYFGAKSVRGKRGRGASGEIFVFVMFNDIESFWSFAKRRLAQFNELSDQTFYLHLKECEW